MTETVSPDVAASSPSATGNESDLASPRDELVRLFVGSNFEKYEPTYEKIKSGKKSVSSWCWAAFFLTFVWYLYCKLYVEAAAILVIPIVFYAVFPEFSGSAGVGFAAAVALTGKSYYLSRVGKKIDRIMAMDEPEESRLELLRKAGGVFWPAAIIGLAIYASLVGLAIWAVALQKSA